LIVKERCSVLLAALAESFCSSAAEKRDYAVFRDVRQLLFCFASAFTKDIANLTT
jgi:hypothetical protein